MCWATSRVGGLALFLMIGVAGCSTAGRPPLLGSAPSQVDTPATSTTVVTPVAELTPPMSASPSPSPSQPIEKVAEGTIADLWWAQDATTLLYVTPGQRWAYDVKTHKIMQMDRSLRTPIEMRRLTEEQLPAEAADAAIAPSGKIALYLTLLSPRRTPAPEEGDGEVWRGGGPAELWLWREGDSHKIGPIQDCISDAIWSKSEARVVLKAHREPCEAEAWLVDVNAKRIAPLVPQQIPSATISSLSPDGARLLYGTEQGVFLFDLATRVSAPLKLPFRYGTVDWVDAQTLLLLYDTVLLGTPLVSTLDVQTSHITHLVSADQVPALQGDSISKAVLSPDGQWLAFAAGDNTYEPTSVWLVSLNH